MADLSDFEETLGRRATPVRERTPWVSRLRWVAPALAPERNGHREKVAV
jgi:hypothetical protein